MRNLEIEGNQFEIDEKDLGPFGYIDIAHYTAKPTVLLAYTDMDFGIGVVFLENDRALVAKYNSPLPERKKDEGLSVIDGLTHEGAVLMGAKTLEVWMNTVMIRQDIKPDYPTAALKYNPHEKENSRFTHLNDGRVSEITQALSDAKMMRMRNAGHYLTIDELVDLANNQLD